MDAVSHHAHYIQRVGRRCNCVGKHSLAVRPLCCQQLVETPLCCFVVMERESFIMGTVQTVWDDVGDWGISGAAVMDSGMMDADSR